MENPKIRIESNGYITEVYFNGKKIENARLLDFIFHAEPLEVLCEAKKVKLDENGEVVFDGDEVVTESLLLVDTRKGEINNDRARN